MKEHVRFEGAERKRLMMKFLICSIIGIILFVFPVRQNGSLTIPISIIGSAIKGVIKPGVPLFATIVFWISGIGALWNKLAKPKMVQENALLKKLLDSSWPWIIVRLIAIVISTLVMLGVGPEFIISENTGGSMMHGVVITSITLLTICAFALPFLIEFGLMEYVGIMANRAFRKIFNLPGRATVDCISSWLGASNIAVVLTDAQYRAGNYSRRESAVIMTCFSAGSISSSLAFLGFVELENMFVPFYVTVTIMGILAALITPRLHPLRGYKDTYYNGVNNANDNIIPEGYTKSQWAVECALIKASESYTVKSFLRDGFETTILILFKVTPVLLTIGSIALMIDEYTNIYYYLGLPFMPFFKLVGAPEATAAAGTLMGSFADNYIPCIIAGKTVNSVFTRFVITLVAYNSLIYMTGPGGIIVQSETKIGVPALFVIFVERVIISIIIGGILARVAFAIMGIPVA